MDGVKHLKTAMLPAGQRQTHMLALGKCKLKPHVSHTALANHTIFVRDNPAWQSCMQLLLQRTH